MICAFKSPKIDNILKSTIYLYINLEIYGKEQTKIIQNYVQLLSVLSHYEIKNLIHILKKSSTILKSIEFRR